MQNTLSTRGTSQNKRPRRWDGSHPYNGFTNDRERRLALRSRDIRLTLIALICSTSSGLREHIFRGIMWVFGQ